MFFCGTNSLKCLCQSANLIVFNDYAVYGAGRSTLPGLERQFLHAFSLAFSLPPGRRWHFEAALPDDLDRILRELRRLRRNS